MRRLRLLLAACLLMGPVVYAQDGSATTFEQLTISTTAIGFTSTTYNSPSGSAQNPTVCSGISEGIFRFRTDGGTPTSSVGMYVPLNATVTISGRNNIARFKAIRSQSSDVTIAFTCYL